MDKELAQERLKVLLNTKERLVQELNDLIPNNSRQVYSEIEIAIQNAIDYEVKFLNKKSRAS